jgi:hypothetical protein
METPAQPKRTIYFKHFKVHGLRDDIMTIPLFHNKWVAQADTTWVTPANMLHKKVR